MKNKSKLNIKLISILLVSIFALTAIFSILNKTNTKKDNSSAKITALEQSLSEAENEILTKNAVLEQKNATITEQNSVIENQRATINSQSETIESQTATIVNKDETISSQAETIESQTTTINSQADTISNQNTTISNQTSRINTLEEELSSEYNYQYTLEVNFYVDNNLYAYGKARNGGAILVSPSDPVKTNYLFYGWSLSANGQVVDLASTTINQNTNFYAIFSDNMLELENTIYSVYHSNSLLSTYMSEQAFLRDIYHALTLSDTSNMTSSELRVEFGNIYDIENPNSVNYETFLKTLINRLSNYNDYYWITFKVDNISICSIRASKTTGLLLRIPSSPTKEDYTFDGWSTTANGTVISNLSQEVFNDNTTLYAVFSAVQNNITYYAHDICFCDYKFGANSNLLMRIINTDSSDYSGKDYSDSIWASVAPNSTFEFLSESVTVGFPFQEFSIDSSEEDIPTITPYGEPNPGGSVQITSIESFTYDSSSLSDYGYLCFTLECNNGANTFYFQSIEIISDTVSVITLDE